VVVTARVLVVVTVLLSRSRPVVELTLVAAVGAAVAAAAGWSGAVVLWSWPPAYTVMPARLSIVIPAASVRAAFTELTSGERVRFGIGSSSPRRVRVRMNPG
jgi:hypothetical protein